ncbi:MAG TPA: DUF1634 domain-containing protein [Patescibacteria group bacterium]|nr:DUF1634 domain-containing protein [Patescibacteria group bacterium]
MDARIARILAIGTRAAVALLAVGSILFLAEGRSPLVPDWPPLDLPSLPAELLGLRPAAFIWLGLIATIATPLLRVAASSWAFGRAGERRFLVLGAAVLVVVAFAIVAGYVGGAAGR